MTLLPAFSLDGLDGARHTFPSGRPAVLCFLKADCPTCQLTMPLVESTFRTFGGDVDVWAIGQDRAGNIELQTQHRLTMPVLDDSALRVSFAYGVEIVPTLVVTDDKGVETNRFVGFGRDDWRGMVDRLSKSTRVPAPEIDWAALPVSRPGCGSRSVDPAFAERLAAEASGSPLRARRIEIGVNDDPFEFVFDQGLTDGLPVVLPTPERVLRMLSGTRRDPAEVVGIVPPHMGRATVEKIAINAVMAGCRPEYLPVVIASVEAVCEPDFNVHGVMATTMGAAPVMIVNGPIRSRIGMNSGMNALGQGNRANATINRALRLVLRNVGGARPGETECTTLGSPLKYTLGFAEWEERSPWEPLHVERGFRVDDSVVTLIGLTGGPQPIVDQTSRSGSALADSLGRGVAGPAPKGSRDTLLLARDMLLVVCPEHTDTLKADGWTKARLRERIGEFTNDLVQIVVAGSEAGKFSAALTGWISPDIGGSKPVSKRIEEASA